MARELDRLYVYVQGRLLAANRTRDGVPLAEARQVLATLKEGWDAVLRSA
jgi:flagellin-specific chaperone FliS